MAKTSKTGRARPVNKTKLIRVPKLRRGGTFFSFDKGAVYELYDINEIMRNGWDNRVVADNVEYLLKRENLMSHRWRVVIPAGSESIYPMEEKDTTGKFIADFEVFSDPITLVFTGTVRADAFEFEDGEMELLEIEVFNLEPSE